MQVELKIHSEEINMQQFRTRVRAASARALIVKCARGKPDILFYFWCAVKQHSHQFSIKPLPIVSGIMARHHSFTNDSAGFTQEPITLGPATFIPVVRPLK